MYRLWYHQKRLGHKRQEKRIMICQILSGTLLQRPHGDGQGVVMGVLQFDSDVPTAENHIYPMSLVHLIAAFSEGRPATPRTLRKTRTVSA